MDRLQTLTCRSFLRGPHRVVGRGRCLSKYCEILVQKPTVLFPTLYLHRHWLRRYKGAASPRALRMPYSPDVFALFLVILPFSSHVPSVHLVLRRLFFLLVTYWVPLNLPSGLCELLLPYPRRTRLFLSFCRVKIASIRSR